MEQGLLKVAAATPKIKVADPSYNAKVIVNLVKEASEQGARLVVFPELCITGSTCGDLFYQAILLEEAKNALIAVKEASNGLGTLLVVGLPFIFENKLYNVVAALFDGKVIGLVPQKGEDRYFAKWQRDTIQIEFNGEYVPFGKDFVFSPETLDGLTVGVMKNAHIVINMAASCELVGRSKKRRESAKTISEKYACAYIYSGAGEGESTQDMVFGGHKIICQNGKVLAEALPFTNNLLYAQIDIGAAEHDKIDSHLEILEDVKKDFACLTEKPLVSPFIPTNKEERETVCEEILNIQSYGLKKRYEHIGCKSAVIGISGGLDSTLALLVTVKAFDLLGLPRENIKTITMPCFGTTNRTYENACAMANALGTTLQEVDIKASVLQHFKDINQNEENHDVTYENAQARERTQVLMDIANQCNALVIGTGDLSELVLGWATYNGDHMSMYGVNAGIPKTLIRVLVDYVASNSEDKELAAVLRDVLDTPVSPELLPPSEGEISQKTEDLVGPYELHDFFLYYVLRHGFAPKKIYQMACEAFEGEYSEEVILKWLKNFYHRFFAQQFKRSCLPDGPRVGSVSVSPRGGLNMPSDASANIWKKQLEEI